MNEDNDLIINAPTGYEARTYDYICSDVQLESSTHKPETRTIRQRRNLPIKGWKWVQNCVRKLDFHSRRSILLRDILKQRPLAQNRGQ